MDDNKHGEPWDDVINRLDKATILLGEKQMEIARLKADLAEARGLLDEAMYEVGSQLVDRDKIKAFIAKHKEG